MSGALRMAKQSHQMGEHASSLWGDYAADADAAAAPAGGLQEACKPGMWPATAAYRGTIMLHHGFTACPQQFDLVVPRLQSAGFTVLTPVMPGHGYRPEVNATGDGWDDNYLDMPNYRQEYEAFIDRMHTMMMAANGEKAVAGLSVGGGVAAMQAYKGGYDRRMLMAPMIMPDGIYHTLLMLMRWNREIQYVKQSWGEDCEVRRVPATRGGSCQFDVMKMSAGVHVGQEHNSDAARGGANFGPGGMQIVFVDEDSTVSTNAVINLAIKYGMDRSSAMICGLDKALPHSFTSLQDNWKTNMYWLPEVNDMIVNYLAHGVNAPQSGMSTSNWPRCDVRCTASTCQHGLLYGTKPGVHQS